MKSKKQLLKSWKVYAVLDDSLFPGGRELLKKFHDLLESPVDVVQLRFDGFSDHSLRVAQKMAAQARRENIPLIVNDRPEIALLLGAAGVHLGKSDIPVSIARKMLGAGAIIGRTIRGPGDLRSLDVRNADYVAIGPVFYTPLKPGLKTVPRSRLRKLCGRVRMPLVAIGGINRDNVAEVIAEGIRTVAFARYGITEKNTRKKIEQLKEKMTEETR
jgi:thiamine-phosphate pyrophosphorylase